MTFEHDVGVALEQIGVGREPSGTGVIHRRIYISALTDVFESIKEKTGGKEVEYKNLNDAELRELFAEYLPDFDRDRVYTNDIRKVFSWYNQLIAAGVTEFKENEIAEDQAAEAAEAADAAQVKN